MSDPGDMPVALVDAIMGGWFDRTTRQMYPGFDIPPGAILLDAGCGDGRMAEFCAPFAARLILVDIDPANVELALANTRAKGALQAEGHVSGLHAHPAGRRKRRSRRLHRKCLEHADDPAAVMAELVRVARPGALFLLTVPAPGSEAVQRQAAPDLYWRKPHHLRVFDEPAFAALVTNAGLAIEKRSGYGFYQTVWWAMFWACKVALEAPHHPALQAWEASWGALLGTADGVRVKQALDGVLPKSQVIIARKQV